MITPSKEILLMVVLASLLFIFIFIVTLNKQQTFIENKVSYFGVCLSSVSRAPSIQSLNTLTMGSVFEDEASVVSFILIEVIV